MKTSCWLFSNLRSFLHSFIPPAFTVWKAPYTAPLLILLTPVPIAALQWGDPQGSVPRLTEEASMSLLLTTQVQL